MLQDLQSSIGKINVLKGFVANSTNKLKAFPPFLWLKKLEDFVWGKEHQEAFDHIKQALASPLVLVPPIGEGRL